VFLGDQIFLVDDADFSARWGWVTILDFAADIVFATAKLALGETNADVSFTENEALKGFSRQGQSVAISSTYTAVRAEVRLDELQSAAHSYARMMFEDATALHPPLKMNKSFLAWYSWSTQG
jgi:hypothetical protein